MQVSRLTLSPDTSSMTSFPISSEQCELLLAFESAGTLTKLAEQMRRDVSVISRQLQKVAELAPVLEKQQGRWQLTALGQQINQWSRDSASSQRRILQRRSVVRIASTREFAARILAPGLTALFPAGNSDVELSILTHEEGIENLILSGSADFGFDCGRPKDPSIRYRTAATERFVVVASKTFLKRHRANRLSEILESPHLQYRRASAHGLLQLSQEVPNVLASFNDIASIREAAVAGSGWAVLPYYAAKRELETGLLVQVPGSKLQTESYGVWWLRNRVSANAWIERALDWLKAQEL